ncbi:Germinal-center associated nuclear protein [Phytophthora citrophthora]|uniref:Germinal-center associated nuclear protein n=1 Tax=Phytophthora citrophthora TaxID=4793 RepID=A0AAD9LQG8_9STRA|nr:Germinal-center associated nuclear protein [Phytophthora citrophthora]
MGSTSTMSPFQTGSSGPASKTTFGQSSGFGSQPPLPPGGMAGAPVGGFGSQPPLPPGGLAGAPPMQSGGFNGASSSGNPFGQKNGGKKKTQQNKNTTFGSTPFGQNGAPPSSTGNSGHTTFGSASSTGGNPKNQSSGFGGGQTAFGGPTSKRGQSSFPQDSNGFGTGSAGVSSKGAAFGSQTSGVKVRKKQITPKSASSGRADNPFTASGTGSGAFSSSSTSHTTFGSSSGGNSNAFTSFGKPSPPGGGAPATTFGSANKRRQSAPKSGFDNSGGFGNSDKMASMEARMSGSKKSFGKGKQNQGFTEQDGNPFGEQIIPRNKFPPGGDAFGAAPKTSPTHEKPGKHRQGRQKKKSPSTSDEETSFVPTLPAVSSSRDENSKAQLSAATNLDGLCADMCSPAERELHIRVDELSVFEKCFPDRPGSERDMIIKRFQRSSADHKLDIAEEIRPPGVLRRTQLYIEQAIMDLDQCGPDPRFQTPRVPEPIELYNFCWDRFRMIRKDFVLQNYRGAGGRVHPIALDIHERIARYHVLSEHELIETPSFVAQQNMEQLGQTLKSLNELYDESNKVGDPAYMSPFEAECRAYFILCTLDNGRGMDVLKYVKDLPRHILESPHMKFAMRVFVARHTGDYFQFFSLLRQATYLQSCLLFRYIPNVRSSALLRMNRAYRSQIYPLEDLVELLCFDDIEHAYSVCQEHQLRISGSPGTGDDSSIIVKFGGDFETDVQLRRNNTPLKIHSSKIYVGMKQGNYLRRDICRGVTEYARDEYPALSKLIQDSEQEEQTRLYPDRPPYEDDYSYFVDYNDGVPAALPADAQAIHANNFSTQQQVASTDQKIHELDAIAQRKREIERKKQVMLERMRELERAKEEKNRHEQAKKVSDEQAAQREEQAKKEALARVQAENEAAESKRQQEALEEQLREQKKQRELEEQRRKAEEAAREAERQRLVALQQAEVMRIKAAEEERLRQEEKRQEELRRKQAEELERQRQQKLAEERARQAREAALEAQRQAQLARERAERKRVRRIEKQRLAVLKLKLHMWKKYVKMSRNGPGPVSIASKLRLDQSHQKAKDSLRWLFRGTNGGSGSSIGMRRSKQLPRSEEAVSPSDEELLSLWSSEDILDVVGGPLRQQNPNEPSIAWKLVIADLLDGASSSFGLWCAVRAGSQDVSKPENDCHRTFQSCNGISQGVAVCTRYLDSKFFRRNTAEAQQNKLAATTVILLPVDISKLGQAGSCRILERRLDGLLSSLNAGCRVTLLALGFASADMASSRASLVHTLESCMERAQSQFATQIAYVDTEILDAGNLLPQKFSQVLKKAAALSLPVRHLKSVGLKELLEGSVKSMMNQFESSLDIQDKICAVFPRVSQDILSSGVMDLTYPPPELQFAVVDPPRGWNSQKRRHEIRTILTALEVTRIAVETSPTDRDQTCDVYFKKVEDFIDRLFLLYPAATAVSTYEVKKRIYCTLLPIHEGLIQDNRTDQVTPQEANTMLPWKKIFEEIYETFFETLNDITIYYPVDWRTFGSNVSRFLDAVHNSTPKQLLTLNQSMKQEPAEVKQRPVQVSMRSVRRSFGEVTTVQKYKAVGEMKRLRVEIEKERAATSQFQRMLRQALNRWND